MALQGTLDTFALPDVLRLLAATKKTGRLRISGSRGNGSIWVSTGDVVGTEASGAPHTTAPVEVLFELLRFVEGSFSFDVDEQHPEPDVPTDVEPLLADAEQVLTEWRSIEAVVPSLDAHVRLARELGQDVMITPERWRTVAAIGSGTSVRRIGDELQLSEIPVCRTVKDLVELGIVEVEAVAESGLSPLVASSAAQMDEALSARAELDALAASFSGDGEAPRRARGQRRKPSTGVDDDGKFVPLDLSHLGGPAGAPSGEAPAGADADAVALDDEEPIFPGLAAQAAAAAAEGKEDADEVARQLANLSPRAAKAVRAAAQAATDEEREAALAEVDGEDEPLNRGLLLKFLSSVRP